jgi:predicted SnoaL-like aldol condensation-catalyzing enzyme
VSEENKELIRRYTREFFDEGSVEAVDRYVAPDVVNHVTGPLYRVAGGKIREHWAVREDLSMLRELGVELVVPPDIGRTAGPW